MVPAQVVQSAERVRARLARRARRVRARLARWARRLRAQSLLVRLAGWARRALAQFERVRLARAPCCVLPAPERGSQPERSARRRAVCRRVRRSAEQSVR
jgi:hypothetical protein